MRASMMVHQAKGLVHLLLHSQTPLVKFYAQYLIK